MKILENQIIYNYCTWTRSIWGFMEQSTTILDEAKKPSSILLYSAPWNLILIKFKCSNCFITYGSNLLQFWNFMKTLKFLKLFENFIILNTGIFLNHMKFLKVYENLEFLKKNWNYKKFSKFSNLKKKMNFNFLIFFYFIIFQFFENFPILFHFLTYWLAKINFCAIKNHIALSCHVISFIDFARECNMIIYCTEIAFC